MARKGFITRALSLYVPWPETAGAKYDVGAVYEGVNRIGEALRKICAAHFNHYDNVDCKSFRVQLEEFIKSCKEANPKPHQAIVYVCSHGVLHPRSGELHLMMKDSPDPEKDGAGFFAKSIPGSELREYMKQLQDAMPDGKVLVLLDCCRAGALVIEPTQSLGDTDVRHDDERRKVIKGGRGLVFFVACQSTESSYVSPRKGPYFTLAVADVLMSAREDEVIDLEVLVGGVKTQVAKASSTQYPQNPFEYPPFWSEAGRGFGAMGRGSGPHERMEQDPIGPPAGGQTGSLDVSGLSHRSPGPGPGHRDNSTASSPDVLSDKGLLDIAGNICGIWQTVGTWLDLTDGELANINGNLSLLQPDQKTHKMLITWRQKQKKPSCGVLADALEKVGRVDVAEKVRGGQQIPSNPPQGNRRGTKREHEGHNAAATSEESHYNSPPKKVKAKCECTPELKELRKLAREVLEFWFDLGIELDVPEENLIMIREDNSAWETQLKKANKMFETWRGKGSSSTYKKLGDALRSCDRDNLAEKYCSMDR